MYISGKLRFWTSAFKLSTQKHHFKLSLWRDLHMSMHVSKCFTLKFARVTKSIDKKKIIATHRFGKLFYWLWKRILAFHFPSLTIVQNCFIEKQKKNNKMINFIFIIVQFFYSKIKKLRYLIDEKQRSKRSSPIFTPSNHFSTIPQPRFNISSFFQIALEIMPGY